MMRLAVVTVLLCLSASVARSHQQDIRWSGSPFGRIPKKTAKEVVAESGSTPETAKIATVDPRGQKQGTLRNDGADGSRNDVSREMPADLGQPLPVDAVSLKARNEFKHIMQIKQLTKAQADRLLHDWAERQGGRVLEFYNSVRVNQKEAKARERHRMNDVIRSAMAVVNHIEAVKARRDITVEQEAQMVAYVMKTVPKEVLGVVHALMGTDDMPQRSEVDEKKLKGVHTKVEVLKEERAARRP